MPWLSWEIHRYVPNFDVGTYWNGKTSCLGMEDSGVLLCMHFLLLFYLEMLGASRSFLVQVDWTTSQQVQSTWTRNDRDAPNSLTQICFCRNSLVASSSSGRTQCSFGSPKSSERAVSILAPSSRRCFTGSVLVGLVPRLHIEPV